MSGTRRGPEGEEAQAETEAEEDAEEAESEWHAWLAGITIVVGFALLIAPEGFVPVILAGVGPIVIAMGIVGWFIQWIYKKRR